MLLAIVISSALNTFAQSSVTPCATCEVQARDDASKLSEAALKNFATLLDGIQDPKKDDNEAQKNRIRNYLILNVVWPENSDPKVEIAKIFESLQIARNSGLPWKAMADAILAEPAVEIREIHPYNQEKYSQLYRPGTYRRNRSAEEIWISALIKLRNAKTAEAQRVDRDTLLKVAFESIEKRIYESEGKKPGSLLSRKIYERIEAEKDSFRLKLDELLSTTEGFFSSPFLLQQNVAKVWKEKILAALEKYQHDLENARTEEERKALLEKSVELEALEPKKQ